MSTVPRKNNKRKKSRKRQRDGEIYPSHQVKWELTGSLMLHAQNKKDSSLCSSVNVWESFVCNCAIHWEPQLQDSPVIPLEMCPRCFLALKELFSRSKASSDELFGSFSHLCYWMCPSSPRHMNSFFCLSFFPCCMARIEATLSGNGQDSKLQEKSLLGRNSSAD